MTKKNIVLIIIIFCIIVFVISYYFARHQQPPGELMTAPLLNEIKTRGKIIVGTEATYPPLESIDEEGNFIGLDIDIAKEIAKDLGVQVEFRNIAWEKLFDALLRREVDMVISAVTITDERAKIMAFSDPYFNAGQVIVTTIEKANTIQRIEELKDKNIGVQIGTTSEIEARKITESSKVLSYENYEKAKEALLKGEIEAIIDYPAAFGLTREGNLIMVGEPFTQEFYGIAVRLEDSVLLSQINATLRRLKNEGRLKELVERYWLPKAF